MVRIDARDLPEGALDAAAAFHARIVPMVRENSGDDLAVLFSLADHTHNHWRKAAIGELAREAAPSRVNGVACGNAAKLEQIIDYLASAPGVTGQMFEADG